MIETGTAEVKGCLTDIDLLWGEYASRGRRKENEQGMQQTHADTDGERGREGSPVKLKGGFIDIDL